MISQSLLLTNRNINLAKLDLEQLGGKAFNLFKMASFKAVKVPPFFVIPTGLYRALLTIPQAKQILPIIAGLSQAKLAKIEADTALIRRFFHQVNLPAEWEAEIISHYHWLNQTNNPLVAVRSSATAEDLEGASFAGQQDTYLNIKGENQLIEAVKKCLASLFTVRATVYRNQQKIRHQEAALSLVVQEMINPRVSGVAFSVDPLSGFDRAVRIDASYGLGEAIVQGMVSPDTFLVTKKDGFLIEKDLGAKEKMIVYASGGGTKTENVLLKKAKQWSLDEKMVKQLAATVIAIEKYYGHYVDVEYGVDRSGRLWILQVSPFKPGSG